MKTTNNKSGMIGTAVVLVILLAAVIFDRYKQKAKRAA